MTLFTKKLALLALMLSSSTVTYAESHCDTMVPYGYPVVTAGSANTTPLCRIAYTVLHDDARKVPLYSAELLLIENIPSKNKRVNAFKADPDLPPGKRAELSDYSELYDRGHMTPFEDARKNSAAALQTFYLSNMVPQELHLNRGLWRSLENKTRKWAQASDAGLYVITGPVFTGANKVLGDGVAIPTYVYKVIIDRTTGQSVGFIVPNAGPAKGTKLQTYRVTVQTVEQATGINFLPSASPDAANALRTSTGSQFNLD